MPDSAAEQSRYSSLMKRIKTLSDIPRLHAELRGDSIALQFEDRRTAYKTFDAHVDKVANGLAAEGVGAGSRIAYLGKNIDTYFEVLFGAARAGVVVTPVNCRLAPREVAYILNDAKAEILLAGSEFVKAALELCEQCPALVKVIVMEGDCPGAENYQHWRDRQPDTPFVSHAVPADIAVQMYTSGTTGKPKGALLSNGALLSMRHRMVDAEIGWNRWTANDVGLLSMPVGHIAGTGWGITSLFFGAMSVIIREFEPSLVLDVVGRHRVSKLFLVPTAMQTIMQHPKSRQTDFSSLQCIMYGASPIPEVLLRDGIAIFGCGFAQQYGMTETSGAIVVLAPQDHLIDGGAKLRAAGKPLAGVELRILDDKGRDLPAGEVGEITVLSPASMAGYWNMPEATQAVLSEDGWLRTGDAGYLDREGYLFIHDRVKDMIVSGGENIYPAEVEDSIYGHPDVSEVAVIGVPDPKWGEAVKAVVVAKPGAAPDAQSVIAWSRQRIASFKAPKSVDFVNLIPRNASGKILRRQIREPYWQGHTRRVG